MDRVTTALHLPGVIFYCASFNSCFHCYSFRILFQRHIYTLIPQHYCKLQRFKYLSNKKFLLWQAAEPSAQDFAMSKNSLILVLQK